MKTIYSFALLCIFVPLGSVYADTELASMSSAERAKEIVRKIQKPKSFAAEDIQNGSRTLIFSRLNMDGTEDIRLETEPLQQSILTPVKVVQIFNKDGRWLIRQNTAARMDVFSDALVGENPAIDDTSDYSISTNLVNGVQCYVVTIVLPQKMIDEAVKTISVKFKNIPSSDIVDLAPVKREMYIGATNFFTYSIKTFNRNNKIINEQSYRNVQFDIVLADDLFIIPTNLTKVIIKNLNDFRSLPPGTQMATGEARASLVKPVWSWIKASCVGFFMLSSVGVLIYCISNRYTKI